MNSRTFIAAALLALSAAAPLPVLADTTVIVEPQTTPPPMPEPSTGAVVITPAERPSADVQTCQETTTTTEDFAGSTTERTRTCVDGPTVGQ